VDPLTVDDALRTSHYELCTHYVIRMEEPQRPPSAASGDGDDIMYIKASKCKEKSSYEKSAMTSWMVRVAPKFLCSL
jgi:hypothetical protein